MDKFSDYIFWGNPVKDWMIALAIIAGCIVLAKIIRSIVLVKMKAIAGATKTNIDDFIVLVMQRTVMPFLYILGVYFGIKYLRVPVEVERIIRVAILVVSVYFILRVITSTIAYFFQNILNRRRGEQSELKQAKGILIIINIIIWIIGVIFLVDNLGYNITTIVTGLGIGGIAIALAAQAILADLFSYLVIFFDKPFETGDFIIIGDKMGTVEYIGIKTTRLRALGGEQLIVANTDLTNSRVQNFKRMEKRRVVFSIGIVYETSPGKLRELPGILKDIISSQPDIQFDRAHFSGFGDFSVNFEIVYYILSADYNIYMDRQQSIFLAIAERFEKENVQFAYPTQRLLLHSQANGLKNEKKEEINFTQTSQH